MITDLLGGHVPAGISLMDELMKHHKSGKLKVLGIFSDKRSELMPEIPTFAEQGFSELTTEEWFGFYAPAKTQSSVLVAANAAINAGLKEKSMVDGLAVVGLLAQGSTIDDMARSQRAEFERWGPLVKRIGFTADS